MPSEVINNRSELSTVLQNVAFLRYAVSLFICYFAIRDADPQANASSGLGVDLKEIDCSIYECLINQNDIREAIYTTDIDGLDIIPSHIDLVGAEIEMLNLDTLWRLW